MKISNRYDDCTFSRKRTKKSRTYTKTDNFLPEIVPYRDRIGLVVDLVWGKGGEFPCGGGKEKR